MNQKPAFDPNAPFEAVKPPFDPTASFEAADEKPAFDASAPHEVVPTPRERPAEAPPIEPVPLPRERPTEAGPRAVEAPPVEPPKAASGPSYMSAMTSALGEGADAEAPTEPSGKPEASLINSFRRGVTGLRQGMSATSLGASARPLNNLAAIEDRLAKGEKPEDIPDSEDLFGARWMTADQRKGVRDELLTSVGQSASEIATRQAELDKIPVHPALTAAAKATKERGFGGFWEEFKKNPLQIIGHGGIESLPSSAPAMVASTVLGPIAGPVVAAAGAGAGSYAVDYASSVLDAMRDEGVNINDPEEIKAAVQNPEFLEAIGKKAHAHAAAVGAVDGMSAGLAEKVLLPKIIRPEGVVAGKVAGLPVQVGTQATAGMAGEALGQTLQQESAEDKYDLFNILMEGVGEMFGAPMEVASMHGASGHPSAVKAPTPTPAAEAEGTQLAGPGDVAGAVAQGVPVKPTQGPGGVVAEIEEGPEEPPPGGAPAVTPAPSQSGLPSTPVGEVQDEIPFRAAQAQMPEGTTTLPAGTRTTTVEDGVITTHRIDGPDATYVADSAGNLRPTSEALEPMAREAEVPAGVSAPALGFYSRLRSWIQEKGPLNATSQRWIAKLKRGEFSQSEAADMGLPTFLASAKGKISKDELLDFVDANLPPLMEVVRRPVPKRTLIRQMTAVADSVPGGRLANGMPNPDHPAVAPLLAAIENSEASFAKYEQYTTPGPRDAYAELTLHLPTIGHVDDLTQNYVGQHYSTPNELVTMRTTLRRGQNGQLIAVLEELQSDTHQIGKKVGYGAEIGKVPRLPFSENWQQLGFNRFLMWAAQNGITHIAWATGEAQVARYEASWRAQGLSEREINQRRVGMNKFYNQTIPSMAKKWSKNLGGVMGYSLIPGVTPEVQIVNSRNLGPMWGVFADGRQIGLVADEATARELALANAKPGTLYRSVQLPSTAIPIIKQGVAMAKAPPMMAQMSNPGAALGPQSPAVTAAQAKPLVDALNYLIKKLGLTAMATVVVHAGTIQYQDPYTGQIRVRPGALGLFVPHQAANGNVDRFQLHINLGLHKTPSEAWVTLTHELGHAIMYTIFKNAPAHIQAAVEAAYQAFKASVPTSMAFKNVFLAQSNVVSNVLSYPHLSSDPISLLSQSQQDYWRGKSEWFAENVAKWASTDLKPLTVVDSFFQHIANEILAIIRMAKSMFTGKPISEFKAVPELAQFLNSFIPDGAALMQDISVHAQQAGVVANTAHLGGNGQTASPVQPTTQSGMNGINGVFTGAVPPQAYVAKAHADKFYWLYKWFSGVHQLADANSHILPLQMYSEAVRIAQLIRDQIMVRAHDVLKTWNKLGSLQADAVSALIDDVNNMVYRTPQEVTAKIVRHPTQQELLALAQKHGVTRAGLAVFAQVTATFQEFLTRYESVLMAEANKITDPVEQQLAVAAIMKQMANYRKRPYFPAMRFGDYTITVRNAAGQVIHFETFEQKWKRGRAARAIQAQLGPGEELQVGYLDRQVRPLLGIPTQLLDMMAAKLNLSAIQRQQLEQLKFGLSPAQSFKHRFQNKRRVAGYSMDFRRAYANYFHHGANSLMKTMFADKLRALRDMTENEVKSQPDITKRQQIIAYLNNHIDNWLDPKSDWASVRAAAFLMQLAFSPAAATQNLTQTLLTSHPFLAQHFGDVSSIAALMSAGRKLETFYKKRSLAPYSGQAIEEQAIYQAMADGIIKETQAPQLAGYGAGDNLGWGLGGNRIQQGIVKMNEWGSFMFDMAEQFNRRLVFRAAFDLAMKNPNAKYVKAMVQKRSLTYRQRIAEGWSPAHAAAYVAAFDATVTTQFEYGQQFAPRVLRGKARSILVFKTFIQSYCMFLKHNPPAAVRSLLIMAALGGFMGLPGADDLKELMQAIAWQLFGKDFDLQAEARKWIMEIVGHDDKGDTAADLILHGMARRGYGIPAFLDMIGGTVGVDIPMPTFDRSRAISSGTILPVELGKIFGPPLQKPEAVIAEQGQKAAGAIFGIGFAMYKALTNTQLNWTDFKRWEGVMPRAIASVSKAYRAWTEGGSRTGSGGNIVNYNVRDPEQMAEVIGMGMGYTPFRQNYEWEKALAERDAAKLVDIKRQVIINQFDNAVVGGDPKEKARMIDKVREFNKDLEPFERGKAITGDTLRRSATEKAKTIELEKRGLPRQRGNVPIYREVEKQYPVNRKELRPVKPSLTP